MSLRVRIRPAEARDIPRLTEIYNAEIAAGVATFDTEPRTEQERTAWFLRHGAPRYPLLVAEADGAVAGYAALSPYRPHDAYASTAELSVYVDAACRGAGVGTRLAEAAVACARESGCLHAIVSVIAGGNEASVRLHERLGFCYGGTLPQVGFKFGAYRDIVHYYLIL